MFDFGTEQPDRRESTVEFIINTIKHLLITKQLKPGDMIPSEASLAENLKVSRSSIREAMKILSAFGVVEIRRGLGTYISESPGKSNIDPFLFNLILSNANTREMVELRELLESQIVLLAINNGTDEDLDELDKIHEQLKEFFEGASEVKGREFMTYELRFHAALGRATRNVLVEKIYNFVMELFTPYIEKTYNHETNGKNAVALHESIVKAIKSRDRDKAVKAIQRSIEEWRMLFNEDH